MCVNIYYGRNHLSSYLAAWPLMSFPTSHFEQQCCKCDLITVN